MNRRKWYERVTVRGYTQVRFNAIRDHAADDELHDRYIAAYRGFGIRRSRIIFSGDVHRYLSVYLQPDFASFPGPSGAPNIGEFRDAYADVYFNHAQTFRFRLGQSSVPYGWETLQSSQNRLALDRVDALDTAGRDGRDIGLFFYYVPAAIRARFAHLLASGLGGSGDFGVVGVGVYNGQGANRMARAGSQHMAARVTYPFLMPNGQYIEIGASAYSGRFVTGRRRTLLLGSERMTPVDVFSAQRNNDQRLALHFIYYPQPFGIQVEWTAGYGPQLESDSGLITRQRLHGGYVQLMYRFQSHTMAMVIPYVKWQRYRGASKFEANSPAMRVDEIEMGARWQPCKSVEITTTYSRVQRTNARTRPYSFINGHFLRLQLQASY
ncbi:porin [Robbsia sp. KACC 23696]|uniref:porin n=1 Tax=Robbsia sp. KACC 23696 TaxID=3149231 RepID=UPI00325B0F16